MKFVNLVLVFIVAVLASSVLVSAVEDKVQVHFFWAQGCPHCADEEVFLEKISVDYPDVVINSYEVTRSSENLHLFKDLGDFLGARVSGVPFTAVGNIHFSGWGADSTTGKIIIDGIQKNIEENYYDPVLEMGGGGTSFSNSSGNFGTNEIPETVKVPFFGEIYIKNLSLPILTIVFGALDGFNPCAMWVLVFLISLLIGMKDSTRRWTFGVVFIVASAFVYFLFMAAWLNLFLFIGFVWWVRIIIGLVALGAGLYFIKDFITNPSGGCKVTSGEGKRRIIDKMRSVVHEGNFLVAIVGLIVLAFSVNLIELVCSAGLPAVYTNVLSMSNLSTIQYYFYLLVYIFIFMLDDLIIFFAAMITLQVTGLGSKYAHWARLIGGIVMLLLALGLIFKPELLSFG